MDNKALSDSSLVIGGTLHVVLQHKMIADSSIKNFIFFIVFIIYFVIAPQIYFEFPKLDVYLC